MKRTQSANALFVKNILQKIPPQHREAITEIIDCAPEPYHGIFLAYTDKIRLNRKSLTFIHSLLFRQSEGMSLPYFGIFMSIPEQSRNLTINGKQYPQWYETLFHEIGHSIDYLSGHSSKKLNPYLIEDVKNYIYSMAREIYSFDETTKEKATQNFLKGIKADDQASDEVGQLQYKIFLELRKRIPQDSYLYDVIGGVTKNALTKTVQGHTLGGLHEDRYWYSQSKATYLANRLPLIGRLVPAISPGLEYFAHNFCDGMLHNQASLNLSKTVFPITSKILLGVSPSNSKEGFVSPILK